MAGIIGVNIRSYLLLIGEIGKYHDVRDISYIYGMTDHVYQGHSGKGDQGIDDLVIYERRIAVAVRPGVSSG